MNYAVCFTKSPAPIVKEDQFDAKNNNDDNGDGGGSRGGCGVVMVS